MTAGFAGNPAEREFIALVDRRMKEKQIDYLSAMREVAREEPELYEISRSEVLHDHCSRHFAAESGTVENFNEVGPDREVVPGMFAGRPNSWELHKKASARAVKKKIPYSDAKREIEAEEPELSAAARGEGGSQIRDVKPLPDGGDMYICSTEFGRTADPNGLFAEIASNRSKRNGISYSRAIAEVRRDYPKLARARDAQVMGPGES